MRTYNIKQAQANFEELVAAVEAGEDVCITRWKTPVVRVVSLKGVTPPPDGSRGGGRRQFGAMKPKATRRKLDR